MKKFALIFIHVAIASVLLAVACSSPVKNKIQGSWVSKDGKSKLEITEKNLSMDEKALIPEEYFIKGDTIYASYRGKRPYTKFVVQKLDASNLTLEDADSVSIEYSR